MSILKLLFGNSNEPEDEQVTVVETSTGWTGTYPGPLTEEVAEIEENGYAVVEQEEEEAQPWWKLW